jgi:hypothetical protein
LSQRNTKPGTRASNSTSSVQRRRSGQAMNGARADERSIGWLVL